MSLVLEVAEKGPKSIIDIISLSFICLIFLSLISVCFFLLLLVAGLSQHLAIEQQNK